MQPVEVRVPQTVQERFVGTWKLAALAGTGPLVDRLGVNPVGILVYDNSGFMSVQIMHRERGTVSLDTLDDYKEAFQSYVGYFGKYTIDTNAQTVTHHVVGSLCPGDVGREFQRLYKFNGDRLSLTAVGVFAGEHIAAELIWQRIGRLE